MLYLSSLLLCTESAVHLHLCLPDQEEAAGCGRLPGGSQGGLHPAGHRLQRGEPHVDEGQCSRGDEAQQRHPPASPDLQRGQLLWRKNPGTPPERPTLGDYTNVRLCLCRTTTRSSTPRRTTRCMPSWGCPLLPGQRSELFPLVHDGTASVIVYFQSKGQIMSHLSGYF